MMLAIAKRHRRPLALAACACLASSCAPAAAWDPFERRFQRRARRGLGFLAEARRADIVVLTDAVPDRGGAETTLDD